MTTVNNIAAASSVGYNYGGGSVSKTTKKEELTSVFSNLPYSENECFAETGIKKNDAYRLLFGSLTYKAVRNN